MISGFLLRGRFISGEYGWLQTVSATETGTFRYIERFNSLAPGHFRRTLYSSTAVSLA